MADIDKEKFVERSLKGKAADLVIHPLANIAKAAASLAEELGNMRDKQKEAYNNNLGPDGSLLNAALNAAAVAGLGGGKSVLENTEDAVKSIQLGGSKGSVKFDGSGGISSTFRPQITVNQRPRDNEDNEDKSEVKAGDQEKNNLNMSARVAPENATKLEDLDDDKEGKSIASSPVPKPV